MVRAARKRASPSGVCGPVLRPPCMRQRSLPRIAGARQGQPARVRAPQRGASARLGLPRRFFVVAGAGWSRWCRGEVGCAAVTPEDMETPILVMMFAICSYNGFRMTRRGN